MKLDQRKRILVTGSTGLIGRRLVSKLVEKYEVIGADRSPPDWEEEHFHWFHCDLTDGAAVRELIEKVKVRFGPDLESVVHLAAYYDFSGKWSELYVDLTVEGTRRLLRCLNAEMNCRQFIFSSSLLVMQPTEDERHRLDETSPTRAEWPYPKSKLQAEAVLKNERGDIPVVILRIAGVYDDFGHCLPIGQQIKRIYRKELESYLFPGDEDHGQAFIHCDDVISAIVRTIERREALCGHEVFLIGEPEVLSHETLQELLGELIHGREWPSIEIPKPIAKAGAWVKNQFSQEAFIKPWMIDIADDNYAVETNKAGELLGWKPKHRLGSTLPKIVEALKDDPRGWFRAHDLPLQEQMN